MSEPTFHELWGKGAGCLSGVGTFLPDTVLQGCRMLKWCLNLPAGHCVAGMQAVEAVSEPTSRHCVAGVQNVSVVSEPTCWALCCRGAECLNAVATYLPALCCRDAGC